MAGSNFDDKESRGRITEHGWVPDAPVRKFRKGKMRPLGTTLAKVNKQTFGKRSPVEAELMFNWVSVVGEDLATFTVPLEIKFSSARERMNGRLVLAVKQGRGLEVQHREPQIIERINSFVGYRAVGQIQLRQRSSLPVIIRDNERGEELDSIPESELENQGYSLKGFKDSALKQALGDWIGVLAARNKQKSDSEKD
jgi:hypothetical protein